MLEKRYWENPYGRSFHYFRYLPQGYDPAKKFPLVFFLHGAGERGAEDGSELDMILIQNNWVKRAAAGEEFPFILLAPQCPRNHYWGSYLESLNRYLDAMLLENAIDEERIYLTGLSMGGTGTWLWALGSPERFAAVAPVCGTGVYWYGAKLADKAVWAFHGDLDMEVLPTESLNMVQGINKRGGHAKLTILHGVGHNAWDKAYEGSLLMDWMLKQRLHPQDE